jgi:hypothetical protein
MSALGQKQTFALRNAMSALPPKADMCSALAYVCFGPIADIHDRSASLLISRVASLYECAEDDIGRGQCGHISLRLLL